MCSLVGIWALIGLQRFAPGFVAPFVMAEFSLSNTQWGLVTGVLAFSWAFGALFAGALSDRYGAKPTLVAAGLFSAFLGWTVGLVQSLAQLIAARLLLGAAEGAIWPAVNVGLAQTVPRRVRARAVSILIASFLIVGVVIGAPLITTVGTKLGWRTAFFLVSVPLFILVMLLARYMTRTQPLADAPHAVASPHTGWFHLLKNRNVLLTAAISDSARRSTTITPQVAVRDFHG